MLKKTLLVSILVFSFALAPIAFADTTSDLLAQIDALMAQVKSLQDQLSLILQTGSAGSVSGSAASQLVQGPMGVQTAASGTVHNTALNSYLGQSISTAVSINCADSDGGQNPNVAGLTDGRIAGVGSYFYDTSVDSNGGQCYGASCTGVAEGYCGSNGKVSYSIMPCISGYSVNGACADKPGSGLIVRVTTPASGQAWKKDSQQLIQWSTPNYGGAVSIVLQNSSGAWSLADRLSNAGSYLVTLPYTFKAGNDYYIRVSELDGDGTALVSGVSGNFTIAAPQTSNSTSYMFGDTGRF